MAIVRNNLFFCSKLLSEFRRNLVSERFYTSICQDNLILVYLSIVTSTVSEVHVEF
jgi:hypothetical protein